MIGAWIVDFSLVGGVAVGVIFAIGTLVMLFHGALSGIRSYMLALALWFLSIVPFFMTYRRCQTTARAASETFTDCVAFTPIYLLAGLVIGILTICSKFVRDDVRRSEQESAHRWRPAAAVVEEGWRQEGHLLKGIYRGHSFESFAMGRIARNQYDPGTHEYRVPVFVKPGGLDGLCATGRDGEFGTNLHGGSDPGTAAWLDDCNERVPST